MRQYLFFLTTVTACGVVLASAGCGDNRGGGNGPDAGTGDVDAASGDAAVDAPTDTGPPACDLVWHDFQFGTDLDDEISGLTTDANHNIYVAGYEHGRNDISDVPPDGDSRGVVYKLDPTGAVKWKTVLDTPGADSAEDVTIDPASGKVYVAGRTTGAFNGFTNKGQFDTVLATLEPTGQIANIFQTGDERPQHPARLTLGPNRSVLLAGYDDLFIEGTAVTAREAGFLASFQRGATLDAPYTLNFEQKDPSSQSIYRRVTGVAIDGDGSGSMYVTGWVSRVGAGPYVKKMNSDGTVVWNHQITSSPAGATTSLAQAVAMSPSNELIVAGVTGVQLGTTSFGAQDAFVMKVDKATGNPVWITQAGSIGADFTTAMAIDDTGNIYIAGETDGSLVRGGTNQGSFDAFVMKFGPDGTLLSTWQKGTATYDFARSIAVDHCGKVFVGVHSQTGLLPGTPTTAGGYDMYVVQATL